VAFATSIPSISNCSDLEKKYLEKRCDHLAAIKTATTKNEKNADLV
jgi:hypothetical protein